MEYPDAPVVARIGEEQDLTPAKKNPVAAVFGSLPMSLVNFRGPLIAEMARRGWDVTATAGGEDDSARHALAGIGVRYEPLRMARTGRNPLQDLDTTYEACRLFRRIRPDLLLCYTAKPVIYGSMAGRLAQIPAIFSIITGAGFSFVDPSGDHRLLADTLTRLYRFALSYNRAVFFQNPDDLRLFTAERGIVAAEKCILVNGSGVDLERFSMTPPFLEHPSFLLIARLIRQKGIGEYVDAARIVKNKHPSAVFRLVGPLDDSPDSLPGSVVREWVEEGVIEYAGETGDVRPFLARAGVYVLPSCYGEGIPRSILEAMAMGRPVITTNWRGCRETVAPGENGFLVPPRDPARLAEAMERFALEPERIEPMGRKSREIAERKFDVREVNRILLETMGIA